jgi:hypothetical protein
MEHNIFVGEALIDAYEYGEKQDWLGFLLTPAVYETLHATQLDVRERIHYRAVSTLNAIKHLLPEGCGASADI